MITDENLTFTSKVDEVDPDLELAAPFHAHIHMIADLHEDSGLHPCAEEILLAFTSLEHIYQFTLHFEGCQTPGHHTLWPEDPDFEGWVRENLLTLVKDPVRAFHIHWRSPDFSLSSMVCEAEGYLHDNVTIPALGRPLMTPVSVPTDCEKLAEALARDLWGPAWKHIPCTHPQQFQQLMQQQAEETGDSFDEDPIWRRLMGDEEP